jgi:hypothetical protein
LPCIGYICEHAAIIWSLSELNLLVIRKLILSTFVRVDINILIILDQVLVDTEDAAKLVEDFQSKMMTRISAIARNYANRDEVIIITMNIMIYIVLKLCIF